MRQKFVAGNWKMYTNTASAKALAAAVVEGLGGENRVRVAVCPPAPYLLPVAEAASLRQHRPKLGGQNCYPRKGRRAHRRGPSPVMLADVGCRHVILPKSTATSSANRPFINRKVHAALAAGLNVILCLRARRWTSARPTATPEAGAPGYAAKREPGRAGRHQH